MKRIKEEEPDDIVPALANISAGSNDANAGSGNSLTPVRTTGRVKKPKLVYDPSDNYTARTSRNAIFTSGAPQANISNAGNAKEHVPAISTVAEIVEQQSPPAKNFDTCMKCNKSEPKRGSGHKSNFLCCKSCMQKWHIVCLPVIFDNLSLARKKFKCDKCRFCCVCSTPKTPRLQKDLLMCSVCIDIYHLDCHYPIVQRNRLYDPKWKCRKCDAANKPESSADAREQQKKKVKTDGKKLGATNNAKLQSKMQKVDAEQANDTLDKKTTPPESPPPQSPSNPFTYSEGSLSSQENGVANAEELNSIRPQPEPELEPKPEPYQLDTELPVSEWSVNQVVNYIHKYYPAEATVFQFQDIDGASLMLLTRQDIITRFGLKLGPSLRLFELVSMLQNRTDDVTLAWAG